MAVQDLDRSKNDKDTVIDIYKALGFENGWVEGDGNYHGDEFHRFNQVSQFTQHPMTGICTNSICMWFITL